MSQARVLLRCIVLTGIAVVLAGCAAQQQQQQQSDVATLGGNRAPGPCANGVGSSDRQAPIVCVDDTGTTLSVRPDPIVIHDKRRGGAQPVTMQWFTRSGGGNLQIEIEEGCVTNVKCNGKGHCTAQTRDIDAETRCKYDVLTDTHPRLDPDLVLTPCC